MLIVNPSSITREFTGKIQPYREDHPRGLGTGADDLTEIGLNPFDFARRYWEVSHKVSATLLEEYTLE